MKTVWQQVEPFRYNTSVWRTDGQADVNNVRVQYDWRTLKIKSESENITVLSSELFSKE